MGSVVGWLGVRRLLGAVARPDEGSRVLEQGLGSAHAEVRGTLLRSKYVSRVRSPGSHASFTFRRWGRCTPTHTSPSLLLFLNVCNHLCCGHHRDIPPAAGGSHPAPLTAHAPDLPTEHVGQQQRSAWKSSVLEVTSCLRGVSPATLLFEQ